MPEGGRMLGGTLKFPFWEITRYAVNFTRLGSRMQCRKNQKKCLKIPAFENFWRENL